MIWIYLYIKVFRSNCVFSPFLSQHFTIYLHCIIILQWVLHYKRKQKRQFLCNNRPINSTNLKFYSQKLFLCVYWNIKGIFHYKLLEHGLSNPYFFCKFNLLNEKQCWKWVPLVNRKGIFHHDNEHPDTAKPT